VSTRGQVVRQYTCKHACSRAGQCCDCEFMYCQRLSAGVRSSHGNTMTTVGRARERQPGGNVWRLGGRSVIRSCRVRYERAAHSTLINTPAKYRSTYRWCFTRGEALNTCARRRRQCTTGDDHAPALAYRNGQSPHTRSRSNGHN